MEVPWDCMPRSAQLSLGAVSGVGSQTWLSKTSIPFPNYVCFHDYLFPQHNIMSVISFFSWFFNYSWHTLKLFHYFEDSTRRIVITEPMSPALTIRETDSQDGALCPSLPGTAVFFTCHPALLWILPHPSQKSMVWVVYSMVTPAAENLDHQSRHQCTTPPPQLWVLPCWEHAVLIHSGLS